MNQDNLMMKLTTTYGKRIATALNSVDASEYSDWLIQKDREHE